MPQSLKNALIAASPRLTPPVTPLRAYAIHGAIFMLWAVLFAMAFRYTGLLAWTTGIAYVSYDTVLLVFVFWQTLELAKAAPSPLTNPSFAALAAGDCKDGDRVTLGVIVAAHNEASVLPVTLNALLLQTDPPDQIVVADDGSTDGTANVMQSLYGLLPPALGTLSAPSPVQPALRWLRLPHGGKARALNAALLQTSSDTVLTVDGDTLLEPDAIAAVREAFSNEAALVAATGVLAPVCDRTLRGRLFQWFQTYEYMRNFLSRYAWMRLDSLLLISGAFAGFRRQAVLDVGGFDADCLVEDYELIHRLRRHAVRQGLPWTTRVLGAARARTEAPSTVGAFLRQRRRWFGGFLQTQYWYRDMVGNRMYGWLGLAMLPVKAVDTLQPLFGLTAFFLLVYYAAAAVVRGNWGVLAPVGGVIAAKIVIDLAFHLWSVHLYRRWAQSALASGAPDALGDGRPVSPRASFFYALLAALAEPFSFQLLRHVGAAWGWIYFLTGQHHWGRQSRGGLLPPA